MKLEHNLTFHIQLRRFLTRVNLHVKAIAVQPHMVQAMRLSLINV